jgi:ribose transport system substrate-binding protein
MHRHSAPRTRFRLSLLGGLAAALTLTACGSSSSSKPSTGSATGTVASSSGADSGLSVAAANVTKYSKLPTALTVTTPLPAAPKPGRTVVFLQCDVAQCTQGGDGFRAAASAIGWKTKTLSWQVTEPATLISDMQEALNLRPKPYAVSISGLPQAVWEHEEAAYTKAGVLLMPWSLGPVTYNKTLFAEIQNPQAIEEQGRLLADWFIVDSKGKGKVLLQNVSQYPSIDEEATGFQDEVTAHCPACSVTTLNVTGSEVSANQVTSTIVSSLQRNPSIEYVMSADVALAPGLTEALQAAGRKVKVLGGAAISTDLQEVRDGTMAVAMATNQYYNGWQMIDALARHAAGLPVTRSDGGGVEQILTKANIAQAGVADQVPAGYPALFKKLWHVG